MVAGGLDAPLREVGRNVARREAEALAVCRATVQLVGRDVGEPLLQRLLLDGIDAPLRRRLGSGRDGAERNQESREYGESSGTHLRSVLPMVRLVPEAIDYFLFVKMLFGILTWTPTLPSTSCVIATSAAMLDS